MQSVLEQQWGVGRARPVIRLDSLCQLQSEADLMKEQTAQRRQQFLLIDLASYTHPSAVAEISCEQR